MLWNARTVNNDYKTLKFKSKTIFFIKAMDSTDLSQPKHGQNEDGLKFDCLIEAQ